MHIAKSVAVELLRGCLPFLILKRRQAELVLAIEAVRAKNSPDRRLIGTIGSRPMPAIAVAQMEKLHRELRSLKSNKRRAR
jgi:hypothetical protein